MGEVFLELGPGGVGAGGRTRTDMSVTSPDFESGAYTNFATPASAGQAIIEAQTPAVNLLTGLRIAAK